MATVTGLTAARMADIEAASIVSGAVVGDDLILTTHGAVNINAGDVRGPQGPAGVVTSLTDEADDVYAPASAGSDIHYPYVSLDLTAGTWLAMAQAAIQPDQVDAVSLAIVDSGPVKRLQGPTYSSLAGNADNGCTVFGIIVVATTMTIHLLAQRTGGSTILQIGNTVSNMQPSQRLTALKIE